MKLFRTLTALASLALLAFATGCASNSGIASFISSLPTNNVTDASLTVQSPLWSHQISVTGMSKSADGTITITNLKDNFSIPLWGTTKAFSVSGLTVSPGSAASVPVLVPGASVSVTK